MTTEQRLDRLEDLTEAIGQLVVKQDKVIEEMRREFKEYQRENRQTRRIWIAIARKQELFDDDEFRDVFGDDDGGGTE